jgi:hypothetical protein
MKAEPQKGAALALEKSGSTSLPKMKAERQKYAALALKKFGSTSLPKRRRNPAALRY